VHGQAPAGGAKVASHLSGRLCPSPWRSPGKEIQCNQWLGFEWHTHTTQIRRTAPPNGPGKTKDGDGAGSASACSSPKQDVLSVMPAAQADQAKQRHSLFTLLFCRAAFSCAPQRT
jgi:hypothetical protein